MNSVGLIHKDVKTRNLLVYSDTEFLKVKIADMGLAEALEIN